MAEESRTTIVERDKKYLWHPLTQHKNSPDVIAIEHAKGIYLYDEHGNRYIDGIASWYTAIYGHCHLYITDKIKQQVEILNQVVFAGFTHRPAVELSEKLIPILPNNQQKLFFSDNGSTVTEVAIKLALQYHYNRGDKHRDTIIAFEDGFHGDTFGAMSVSNLSVYNGAFEQCCIKVERIPVPTTENIDMILYKLSILVSKGNIAGFIFEPIIQGAAAMKIHDIKGLDKILAYLKSNDVLTIADEVMTGFGKTGKNFACEYLTHQPDMMCFSKALTAGIAPMGITSCTQQIYDIFYDDEVAKGFFHGHTYTANPIACTAAVAGIDLLTSQEMQDNIKRINTLYQEFDKQILKNPKVKNTRMLGTIYALDLDIDMERYGQLRHQLFQSFMSQGVCLRPLGKTIYISPPYVISDTQLSTIFSVIERSINQL